MLTHVFIGQLAEKSGPDFFVWAIIFGFCMPICWRQIIELIECTLQHHALSWVNVCCPERHSVAFELSMAMLVKRCCQAVTTKAEPTREIVLLTIFGIIC